MIVVVLVYIGNLLHQHTGSGVIEFHLCLNARFLLLHVYHIKCFCVVRSLQEINLVVSHPRRLGISAGFECGLHCFGNHAVWHFHLGHVPLTRAPFKPCRMVFAGCLLSACCETCNGIRIIFLGPCDVCSVGIFLLKLSQHSLRHLLLAQLTVVKRIIVVARYYDEHRHHEC